MAVVRKKQDDKILKTLRELVTIGGNKECFDCSQRGPTYINMTIGSFVCTTCSGILRGLTPPHRVKSISMATFTQEEIDFVRQNGNDACSRTWLGLWDPKRAIKQEHRDFMIDKYERKRYYLEPASPLKSLSTSTSNSTSSLPVVSNGLSSSSNNINSRNGTENNVPLKTITLTPPTSLRLSRTNSNSSGGINGNGNHTTSSVTTSSTNLKFQQQFTPDDSNFFSETPPKILPPTPQKHSNNHHQRLNGTVNNGNGVGNFERSQRNGLLTNCNSNGGSKFTPDSDFVADFSNANIVSVNGTANGSANGTRSNGINRLSNGFNDKANLTNGHPHGSDMENFADFEHNQIYNAAGVPISASSKSTSAQSTSAPSVDRYAALKDLDDQFREIKLECETNNNNNSHNVNGTSNGGLLSGNHSSDLHQTPSANPFKSANPFQQQQQSSLNWSIPGSSPVAGTTTTSNGFYGTSPYQNGFAQAAHLLNGNGGVGFTNAFHHHAASSTTSSGTGYGSSGIGNQLVPQFGNGHFGNPFVAAGATTGSSNSNNPFL